MRERPILFSAPMVRAIMAGTKTQTRRVVKPVGQDDGFVLKDYGDGWWPYRSDDGESPMKGDNEIPHSCPYGQPGDRLWVRETWLTVDGERAFYRADYAHNPKGDSEHGVAWRPAIDMARWASRITLEVTSVRVERLQDISEADAVAEGAPEGPTPMACMYSQAAVLKTRYREGFAALWEQINGPGSWDANPWVWVVQFRRVDAVKEHA